MNRKLVNRFTKKNDNSLAITVALLAGATLGAAISLLLAPKTGQETREIISDKAKSLASGAKDRYQAMRSKVRSEAEDLADTAKDKYETVKDKASNGIEELTDEAKNKYKSIKNNVQS